MRRRAFDLHGAACDCSICRLTRQREDLDRLNRNLANAAASGDEAWYERLLRERGSFRNGEEF